MMTLLTILIGLLLSIFGVMLWLSTDAFTSLIPAFAGLPILACGLAAIHSKWHTHALHGAMVLALLTTLMPLVRLPQTIGEHGLGSVAALSMIIMMMLGALLLIMGIYSFIDARRRRKTAIAKANV